MRTVVFDEVCCLEKWRFAVLGVDRVHASDIRNDEAMLCVVKVGAQGEAQAARQALR